MAVRASSHFCRKLGVSTRNLSRHLVAPSRTKGKVRGAVNLQKPLSPLAITTGDFILLLFCTLFFYHRVTFEELRSCCAIVTRRAALSLAPSSLLNSFPLSASASLLPSFLHYFSPAVSSSFLLLIRCHHVFRIDRLRRLRPEHQYPFWGLWHQ